MAGNLPLPEKLRPFFWDYPFVKLSWSADQALIIRRILVEGSWEAILWLQSQIGDPGLKEWLIAHRGRGLSPRQLRFWGLILDLPEPQVDQWVQAAFDTPWGRK